MILGFVKYYLKVNLTEIGGGPRWDPVGPGGPGGLGGLGGPRGPGMGGVGGMGPRPRGGGGANNFGDEMAPPDWNNMYM